LDGGGLPFKFTHGGSTMSKSTTRVATLKTAPAETATPQAAETAPATSPLIAEPPVQVIEASVDGRRIKVFAQDEIVFECGQASITLRRNGRIIIRGTYVETHSEGTNRIKGGQVRIN
jgi:hypothetical protein